MTHALRANGARRLRTPLRALALASAIALCLPAAQADGLVVGFVATSPGGQLVSGPGDYLFPNSVLWVGFSDFNPSLNLDRAFNGRFELSGGVKASFANVSMAQTSGPGSMLIPGTSSLFLRGLGTKLSTQGYSTGVGDTVTDVDSGAHFDGRVACADKSFNFFFCSSRVGTQVGKVAELQISNAGSLYETRAMSIATAGPGTNGGTVTASVGVFDGGTIRTWNVNVGGRNGSPSPDSNEKSAGSMLITGAGSTWIVDGYDSVANNPAPSGFTPPAPGIQLGTFAGGSGQLLVEDGGTLRFERKDATQTGVAFLNLGAGGTGTARVTGTGSKIEFEQGLSGAVQVGRRAGGSSGSSLQVDAGGLITGANYLAVGRANFASGVQDGGGIGTLVVEGAGSLIRLNDVTATSVGQFDIARGSGSQGTVTVRNGGRIEILGSQARTNGPLLRIGVEGGETGAPTTFTGSGVLNIQGAGSVVQLRAEDVAGGANSTVRVGRTGTGTGQLNVSAGGKLLIEGYAASTQAAPRNTTFVVGGSNNFNGLTGGNGSALITGAGSEVLMKGNDRYVGVGDGPGANGQLTISDGGKLTSGIFHVGRSRGTGVASTGSVVMNNGHVLLDGKFDSGTLGTTVGSGLVVGTDAGSVGTLSMSNGSTMRVETAEPGRFAAVMVGSSPTLAGGVGSLVMATGSSIAVDGTSQSLFGIGTNGGTGSLTMNASTITLAANGEAKINGSALLANGSTFVAGAFLGIGVDGGLGTLQVNNSTVRATDIVIGAGGILGGNGATLIGNVTNFGIFSPGASPGTFTIQGNYKAEAGSKLILEVEADGLGGFKTDEVIFGGTVDLNGRDIEFRFLGNTDVQGFINTGGFQIDNFLKKASGGGLDDSAFIGVNFTASAGGSTIDNFSFDPTVGIPPVPEPQTWALMALGLAALGGVSRRRQRQAQSLSRG
jgi:T5SS/PEP-CTERM-associated repeat protein